ncbi:hypothetical protein Val02_36010 [Virgisporangium aliadipatigenens]|uniref:Peptidase S24/S26A/S26B/S26C domain-containing protein n=1 Tax=Virgisporangium aliadipatigenens TaxID=741659 RepID=A0A8J3YMM7_9ACTN|nr:hypothetical protein Val02_36010 [Virgisporangium aliadipatigenens]
MTIPADQDPDDELALPEALVGHGTLFALTVRGDSMIGAAIRDGDIVVVRRQQTADSGDIVAALVDGETTVAGYRVRDGRAELVPRNPAYDAIPGEGAEILGKVVSVVRRI